jgi:hypothetical protein
VVVTEFFSDQMRLIAVLQLALEHFDEYFECGVLNDRVSEKERDYYGETGLQSMSYAY